VSGPRRLQLRRHLRRPASHGGRVEDFVNPALVAVAPPPPAPALVLWRRLGHAYLTLRCRWRMASARPVPPATLKSRTIPTSTGGDRLRAMADRLLLAVACTSQLQRVDGSHLAEAAIGHQLPLATGGFRASHLSGLA